MSAEVTFKVKKEVERMIEPGLVKMARFVEYISIVVSITKKNEICEYILISRIVKMNIQCIWSIYL